MAYNIPANGEPPELSEGGLREAEGVNATGAQADPLFGVLFYLSQTLGGQASSPYAKARLYSRAACSKASRTSSFLSFTLECSVRTSSVTGPP